MNNKNMEVSVIIPVYNAEKYVEKAILSALNQAEVKEVILVEDGSLDNSLAVCAKLEEKFEAVKLFYHPGNINKGAGPTRNLGIQSSTCPYIAFLDADDYFLDDRFQTARKVFESTPDADGVYEAIGTFFYSEKAKENYLQLMGWKKNFGLDPLLTSIEKYVEPEHLFDELLIGRFGWFSGDGLTVKRSLFQRSGYFDTELRLSQDTELWLRMALTGKLYPGQIYQPIAMRGVHEQNRSTDKQALNRYRVPLWQKIFYFIQNKEVSKNSRRRVLLNYLDHYNPYVANLKGGGLRKVVKMYFLLNLCFKYPEYLYKCL